MKTTVFKLTLKVESEKDFVQEIPDCRPGRFVGPAFAAPAQNRFAVGVRTAKTFLAIILPYEMEVENTQKITRRFFIVPYGAGLEVPSTAVPLVTVWEPIDNGQDINPIIIYEAPPLDGDPKPLIEVGS